MGNVTVRDSGGRAYDVPEEQLPGYLSHGFTVETPAEHAQPAIEAAREDRFGGEVPAAALSATTGALGTVTGGLSDAALSAIGGSEGLREVQDLHPIAHGLGALGAAFVPVGLPGLAGKAGAAIRAGSEGAGLVGGIARAGLAGATEGALYGAGQGVSELALSQDPLTLEHAAATLSSNALFGAVVGSGTGAALKGVELGLGGAKRALDRALLERSGERAMDAIAGLGTEAAGAATADLSGLDAKGLRTTRAAELDRLTAAEAAQRTADRSSAVDDVLAYRQNVKDVNPWLVITEGEPSKQLNNASKSIRAALDDPRGLRESPGPLLRPLRIEEQALQTAVENRAAIAAKLDETNAKIAADLEKQLPRAPAAAGTSGTSAGFDVTAHAEGGPIFEADPAMHRGVPAYGDLDRATFRENAYVVRPSELKGPKLRGIVSGEDMLGDARTAKVREAWGKGESVPALEIDVDPKGRYFVADGNHRLLAAAADGDRPVLARFRPVEAEVGKMDRIGPELKRALGAAPARPAAAESIELTGRAARRYAAYADVRVPRGGSVTIASKDAQGFLDALRGGKIQSQGRDALNGLDGLLEQNRALQSRLKAATSPATARDKLASGHLSAIDAAEEALSGRSAPPKAAPEPSLFGGALRYAAHAVPFGGLAEKAVGALGGLRKAASAGAERVQQAASTFLGKAAPVVGKAASIAPPVATKVLAALRYGEPETDERGRRVATPEPKTLPELYRARTDEIKSQVQIAPDGTYQMRPAARAKMAARLSGLGAVDPIAADRMESAGAARIAWLASQMPQRPDLAGLPVGPDNWNPSDAAMRGWTRKAAAVEDPYGVLERASAGAKARVVPEEIMALRALQPALLNDYVTQIVAGLSERKTRLPYPQRLALSMLTGRPLDPAMTPSVLRELQSMHAGEPGTAGGTMAPRSKAQFGSVKRSDPGTPAQRRQGIGL